MKAPGTRAAALAATEHTSNVTPTASITHDRREHIKVVEVKFHKFVKKLHELKETIRMFNEASVKQEDMYGKVRFALVSYDFACFVVGRQPFFTTNILPMRMKERLLTIVFLPHLYNVAIVLQYLLG
jgi:hypothetical protein